jgi:hypothetical protein
MSQVTETYLVHAHWANGGDDFDRYYPVATLQAAAALGLTLLKEDVDARGGYGEDRETYAKAAAAIERGDFKAAHQAWQDTFILSGSVPSYVNVARIYFDGTGSDDVTLFD